MAGKTRRFKMSAMAAEIETSASELCKAIKRQTGAVDKKQFLADLQKLVAAYGLGEETVASDRPRAQYNVAGDVLCLAFMKSKQGKMAEALELAAIAFTESPGMTELVKAIADMNSEAPGMELASADGDEEEEAEPVEEEDESEEEESDAEADEAEEIDDSEEDLEETISRVVKRFGAKAAAAEDEDESEIEPEDEPEVDDIPDEDEIEEAQTKVSARLNRKRKRRETSARALAAVANKISITGDKHHRRLAKSVLNGK